MQRNSRVTPNTLYHGLYRFSSAFVDLRDTLMKLRRRECLQLANGMTIERYSATEFDVRDASKKLYARGALDNVLAYATSSDEIDAVTDTLRRNLSPRDNREDDVELAKLLSEK